MRVLRLTLILLTAIFILAPPSFAQTVTWDNTGTGDWSDGTNWDTGSEPSSSNRAIIDNGGTAEITQAGETVYDLRLGATDGDGVINMTDGDLTAYLEYVGYDGTGVFNHSGGTNKASRHTIALIVGNSAGSHGTYNLSDTGVLDVSDSTGSGKWEIIGFSGTGIFNQYGGSNTTANTVYIGYNNGSVGTYTITGGNLAPTGSIHVGENSGSTGTLIIDGGDTVTKSIYVGSFAGSTGYLDIKSGNLSVPLSTAVPPHGTEVIGRYGTGIATQTGGTHYAYNLNISEKGGSKGTYTISENGSLTVRYEMKVGTESGSDGTLNIYGGQVESERYLRLGHLSGATGVVNMTDGTLTGVSEYIGMGGTGTFEHSGGTNTTGNLYIGNNAGSVGTYNLSGTGDLDVSNAYIGNSGTGTLEQSGGTHNLGGVLYLANREGSTGTYILSGTDNTVALDSTGKTQHIGFRGEGHFVQEGADSSNTSKTMVLGYYPTGVGTYTQTGGTNTVTGDLQIGYGYGLDDASALENQSYYDLQGGQLTSNRVLIGGYTSYGAGKGTFLQSGGTHQTGHLILGVGTDSNTEGIYTQTGGTVNITAYNGILIAGQPASVGVYTFKGGDITDGVLNADLTVRNHASSSGTFEGHGVVDLSDVLTNSGRIIANGYGVESTLDLTSFNSVKNKIDNTTDNGWYAVDKGKLALPSVLVAASDITYNWGETPGDTDLDLINSVSMTFHDVVGSGWVDIELLATDRSEVFDLTGGNPITFWDFNATGFTFSSVDLVFRYDDSLILDINKIQLIHYDDFGVGTNVLTGIDPVKHLLYAEGVTSFSGFAVAVPEIPTSAIPIVAFGLFGSLFFMRKRLAKGKVKCRN